MSITATSVDKPTVILVHGAFAESSSWNGGHQAHVMVALGPVDPDQQHGGSPPRLDLRSASRRTAT
jgi:hypothetical protein